MDCSLAHIVLLNQFVHLQDKLIQINALLSNLPYVVWRFGLTHQVHPTPEHEVVVALFTQLIDITERVQLGINCLLLSFGGYPASSLVKSFEHPLTKLICSLFVGLYLGFGVSCLRALTRAHEPVLQILAFCESNHLLLECEISLCYHWGHFIT